MFTAFPIQFILYNANLYRTATFQSPKGGSFRLLKTLSKTEILMVHYYHSLSILLMLQSWYQKKCSITGKHGGIIFLTQKVTIATL